MLNRDASLLPARRVMPAPAASRPSGRGIQPCSNIPIPIKPIQRKTLTADSFIAFKPIKAHALLPRYTRYVSNFPLAGSASIV